MANVTVSIPQELRRHMRRYKRVNWSEVARKAFEAAIRQEEMRRAAEGIDELRLSTRSKWSGTKEIRRWRNRLK